MKPQLEILIEENAQLRLQLARKAGFHTAYYSPQSLAALFDTDPLFWRRRVKNGDFGEPNTPGGPIGILSGGDWRIPGNRVWDHILAEPVIVDSPKPVIARTVGELRRKAPRIFEEES
jgi:hypothetical protein